MLVFVFLPLLSRPLPGKRLYLHPELQASQKTLGTAKCPMKAARLYGCATEQELSVPLHLFCFLFPSTPVPQPFVVSQNQSGLLVLL